MSLGLAECGKSKLNVGGMPCGEFKARPTPSAVAPLLQRSLVLLMNYPDARRRVHQVREGTLHTSEISGSSSRKHCQLRAVADIYADSGRQQRRAVVPVERLAAVRRPQRLRIVGLA